jgi:hypothetical protein
MKIQKYCKGQVVIILIFFFLSISLIVVLSSSFIVLRETKVTRDFFLSQKSYFLAEAGIEDLSYRLLNAKHYNSTESLTLDDFSTTIMVSGGGGQAEILSTANVFNLARKIKTNLITGISASFYYGLQVGEGGLVLENSSSVSGNVYSNGPIRGAGSNLIIGDAVSAGANGSIKGIHATSSVYAHNISESTIDRDAHYVNISDTTVGGTLFPNSPDQPTSTMPISDNLINDWEAAAEAGGIINSPCPYTIDSNVTIGPVKINCNLEISHTPTVTVKGPIWVVGNITFTNSPIIKLDSSLENMSVPIIADNHLNRDTGSRVSFNQSVTFQGSGNPNSYILFISQNNSVEEGGTTVAISSNNSAEGKALVYAPHGEINLYQSGKIKEVTAYKIHLRNSAQVIYETGLASLLFNSGPSGGYSINNWEEVP